jgi:cobalt/nickel transport system permease protein
MHIVDGVLSPEVCAVTGVAAVGAVGYSLHRVKDSLADRTVPLTGMMSALIFAGQMVNFPLIGTPVSGHLLGGVLAAAVLGPWAGCLAITLVLVVQCALFGDGGPMSLGANVLHMAVIGSLGGYAVYSAVRRLLGGRARGTVVAAVVAAWLSVMAAAALFCVEFRLSWLHADYDFTNIFALMVTFHSAIGVGEALITGGVISFVLAQRPDLLYAAEEPVGGTRRLLLGAGRAITAGVILALAVAAFLAPFASEFPDGLEAVAQRVGFDRLAGEPVSLLWEDYSVPLPLKAWNESALWQRVSVSLAGLVGTAAVLAIALVFGKTLSARTKMADPSHVE